MKKSLTITEVLSHLRRSLGTAAFDVLDYWPDDPNTIGVARPGSDEPCVCILAVGKEAGRYDVEQGGKLYRDCVIDGVEWAVRKGLQ